MTIRQAGSLATLLELGREAAVSVFGLVLLATLVVVLVAVGYRRTTTRRLPIAIGVLTGTSVAAVWVVTRTIKTGSVVGHLPVDGPASSAVVSTALVLTGFAAVAGRHLGDLVACDLYDIHRLEANGDAASLLRSARVVVAVDLPDEVADVEGYEPIDESIQRDLEGTTVRFPRSCSLEERRDRLRGHVRREYGIDIVDVTFGENGTIDRLAVGNRQRGLADTLPSNTVAVSVRGLSSSRATPGDAVEVWTAGSNAEFVSAGTLRATTGEIATVVVDAENADAFEYERRYRVIVAPDGPDDAYEFVSTLRGVEETIEAVSVEPDGPFAGEFVGWLPGRVLAIERDEGLVPLPDDRETLQEGDDLWVLGGPATLEELTTYDPEGNGSEEGTILDPAQRT
ncbi:TrkA C-terminal domain-containing protein [Natrialbaceae archaeon A-gly3]